MKKAAVTMNIHIAIGIISYFGILKHCNSFNFRKKYVYPYTNKKLCIRVVAVYMARKALT